MTQAFDFFTQTALPTPDISAAQAGRFVQERYGIDGVVTELGSQQDANFLIEAPAGKYVLKVSNPAFTVEDLAAQDAAARARGPLRTRDTCSLRTGRPRRVFRSSS